MQCTTANWISREIVITKFIWNAKEKVQPAQRNSQMAAYKMNWKKWLNKEEGNQMSRAKRIEIKAKP